MVNIFNYRRTPQGFCRLLCPCGGLRDVDCTLCFVSVLQKLRETGKWHAYMVFSWAWGYSEEQPIDDWYDIFNKKWYKQAYKKATEELKWYCKLDGEDFNEIELKEKAMIDGLMEITEIYKKWAKKRRIL